MKYKILEEKLGKTFIFNNEDLPKLTIRLINLLTCLTPKEQEDKTSYFVFDENNWDHDLIEYMLAELKELGFEIIQE